MARLRLIALRVKVHKITDTHPDWGILSDGTLERSLREWFSRWLECCCRIRLWSSTDIWWWWNWSRWVHISFADKPWSVYLSHSYSKILIIYSFCWMIHLLDERTVMETPSLLAHEAFIMFPVASLSITSLTGMCTQNASKYGDWRIRTLCTRLLSPSCVMESESSYASPFDPATRRALAKIFFILWRKTHLLRKWVSGRPASLQRCRFSLVLTIWTAVYTLDGMTQKIASLWHLGLSGARRMKNPAPVKFPVYMRLMCEILTFHNVAS